jgi:hypothetical protein
MALFLDQLSFGLFDREAPARDGTALQLQRGVIFEPKARQVSKLAYFRR